MPFNRLTNWQSRFASLLVALAMMTMNMVIPGLAAFGSSDSCASPDTPVISVLNQIDEQGSGTLGDPADTYDDRENSDEQSDNCDDCTLGSVSFSIDRGRYFGSLAARSFIGQFPAPEHRPPIRR